MGEIIQIHVGQAGVQIANACWELYCLEHGIQSDGTLCECPYDNTYRNFFASKDTQKVVPRAVLVDAEPTVIDQVRTGPFGRLYSPGSLITGKEDSGSNFARGYYTTGAELIEVTMDAIRHAAESSCSLQGFLTFRSIGGGTGSGLGNAIAERIQDEYDKVAKLEFVINPSPSMSPLIVEPYNALLATHMGMDAIECTFVLDNEALYDICESKLNVSAPKYTNLNRIIGQTASTFTTSQRFGGSSSMSFLEFETNLVPYPRIHFPVVSYAPFIAGSETGHTNLTTEQITNACFDPSCQLVRCNPTEGKYMACVLLYRGNVSTSDINYSLSQLRAKDAVRFVDWSPTGFKVGMNKELPFSVPGGGLGNSSRSLVTLSNNTIIHKAWCRLIEKYERLYSRRAFIHHFVQEGLEEDSLKEASEDIYALISDYREVEKVGPPSNDNPKKENLHGKRDPQGSEAPDKSKRIPKKSGSDVRMAHFKDTKIRREVENASTSNFPVKNKSQERQSCESEGSSDDLSLPQLPGLQSLNYFFGESNSMENGDPSNARSAVTDKRPRGRSVSEKLEKSKPILPRKSLSNRLNFEQGLNTEACRAKDKFCQMPKDVSCNNEPGKRLEKTTSCQPQACERNDHSSSKSKLDCCDDRQTTRCYQFVSSNPCDPPKPSPKCQPPEDYNSCEGCCYTENEKRPKDCNESEEPLCCSKCPKCKLKQPKCFCCNENVDDIFATSDDNMVTVCCRPRKCRPSKCVCNHEMECVFNVAGKTHRCLGSHPICCNDEIDIWCPSDDRVHGCCPECSTLGTPRRSLNFCDDNEKTLCVKFQKKNK